MLKVVRGELDSGKLYASCAFDGFHESCFVDTGATFSSLANLERFGTYPATGTIRFKSASGVPKEADEITISALQIDSDTLKDVKVARLNPKEGFESVIGINAIGSKPFAFQFNPDPVLNLDPQRPDRISSGVVIYEKGIFSIPVQVGNAHARGLWDTGAGLTSIDVEYVNAHPDDFSFVMDISNGSDATGNPVVMKLYKAKRITVGTHVFENENVLAIRFDVIRERISNDVSLIVGFNLITKANWYFDLPKKQWAAE